MTPEEKYAVLHKERVESFDKKQVGKMQNREKIKGSHYECTKTIEHVKNIVEKVGQRHDDPQNANQ